MATDSGEGPGTDFILSYRAYGKMAVPRMASLLYSLGVVDVEYQRISCHEGANLVIKIVEHSNYPWYLAIVPLKQGGANDILSIEVYEVTIYLYYSFNYPILVILVFVFSYRTMKSRTYITISMVESKRYMDSDAKSVRCSVRLSKPTARRT